MFKNPEIIKEKLRIIAIGRKHTIKTKEKISESNKGRIVSQETRIKISNATKGKKRLPFSEEHKKKIAMAVIGKNKGKVHSEDFKNNLRIRMSGPNNPMKNPIISNKIRLIRLGDKNPSKRIDAKKKISETKMGKKMPYTFRKKISAIQQGISLEQWNGFKSPEYKLLRDQSRPSLIKWRQSIFKRDNYTCQECYTISGNGYNVVLHPHHIKKFSKYPELRFDINNGITLCKRCHSKTIKKEEQFEAHFQNKLLKLKETPQPNKPQIGESP